MAKKIEINLTDAEFTLLKNVYAQEGVTEDADYVSYIKTKLTNVLKSAARNYDEKNTDVTYTSFDPS
tara:strand:+ start:592 stop:792 length:201 start_codon:yes stop_codon:yes gene_type:complete